MFGKKTVFRTFQFWHIKNLEIDEVATINYLIHGGFDPQLHDSSHNINHPVN